MPDTAADPVRLQMRGVSKRFGATVALADVDLSVRAGEVHALIGENGAGKSTLMKVLSGAIQPDAGRMQLDGEAYSPRNPAEGRRAGVAMIYQELSLAPHLSVMENIVLGAEPVVGPFISRRQARETAARALAKAGRGDLPLSRPVSRLPIADQQIVEIARAVAADCRVLVLDEPTSSLGAADTEHLFALVDRLRADGYAIVYISHVLEEVSRISDRYTVLRDGRVVGGGSTADADVSEIITMMVGRSVRELYPRSPREPGEVVLEVDNLRGERAPTSATLTLRRGQVIGIAGLVGAGRTELLRAIFGLDPVVQGRVRVGLYSRESSPDMHVRQEEPRRSRSGLGLFSRLQTQDSRLGRTPDQRWRQGVGFVSEDRKVEGLATNLNVADNITLAALERLGPVGLLSPTRQRREARAWIDRVAIKCGSTQQLVDDLSGGNQQKVAIARLLFADVDVLLLDEPTRGIDVGSKAQLYQLIDDLASGGADQPPKAILMVSSYLPELLGVCDHVAVMCRGVLGPARPVGELNEHALMVEATGMDGRP
jgi:ribose transport system ATP-binding protein